MYPMYDSPSNVLCIFFASSDAAKTKRPVQKKGMTRRSSKR